MKKTIVLGMAVAMLFATSPVVFAQDQGSDPWTRFRIAIKDLNDKHGSLYQDTYVPVKTAAQEAQKALREDKSAENRLALAKAIYNQIDVFLDVTKSRLEIAKSFAENIPAKEVDWLGGYQPALEVNRIDNAISLVASFEEELVRIGLPSGSGNTGPVHDQDINPNNPNALSPTDLQGLRILRTKIVNFRTIEMLPILGQLRSDRVQAGVLKVEFVQEGIWEFIKANLSSILNENELIIDDVTELSVAKNLPVNSAWGKLRDAVILLKEADAGRKEALALFNSIGGFTGGPITSEVRATERGKFTSGRDIIRDKVTPTLASARKLTYEVMRAIQNYGRSCTTEYVPVCGEVEVQCVQAPCDPVQQTFGNKCELEKAGAKFVHEGVCIGDRPD